MIRPVTFYEGICDGCGKRLEEDCGAIITAWTDKLTVSQLMKDSDWLEIGGKHYCPDCYECNEEDKYIPKQKGGKQ